jgi:RimJ/RimL family protein N-acetyltransferase
MTAMVTLRPVQPADIPAFFEHQLDPAATAMAAFPARDRAAHDAHWTRLLKDPGAIVRTIDLEGRVAGNIGSWDQQGARLVGFWVGREFWGAGVASAALRAFLDVETRRPLRAFVAVHNGGSLRVLEKCGFVRIGVEHGASPGLPPVDEVVLELAGAPVG